MNARPIVIAIATLAAAAPAQEAAVRAAEAFIRKHDANGDNRIRFEEFRDAAQFKQIDKNGDGQITVADFVQKAAATEAERARFVAEREYYRYAGIQTVPRYDKNHDGVLDDEEVRFLLVVVMDLDEDRVLNPSEIRRSRAPPGLDADEGWFQKDAKAIDQNGDGVVTLAEMRVPDAAARALDKNRDGRISLEEMARAQVEVMGGYLQRFHEMSDAAGKLGTLDKANWSGDPGLFRRIDEDRNGAISVTEFDQYARRLKTTLSMCNDFVTRHDLDGDGRVSRREFPGTDSMFLRMDKNRDGFVTSADR